MDYYPRHAYVDWTGVDGYNCGTKNGGWQSFERVFQKIYPLLATKKKPILIGEMSSSMLVATRRSGLTRSFQYYAGLPAD
jgi:beta-mannanase